MWFVNKSPTVPKKFAEIMSRHNDYLGLSEAGADRNQIKLILLNEQGCLCPFCERKLTIEEATIEHFQPKSTFKHLQLDYYNLFACCQVCNGNKTDHLLPAYIFDERANALDPRQLILNRHLDFQFYFQPQGEHGCVLKNNALDKVPKDTKQFYANWIFHHTIEILGLNEEKRLSEPRRRTMNWVNAKTENLSKEELLLQYKKFKTPRAEPSSIPKGQYLRLEPFAGMILYIIAERLRKKGVDLSSL